MLLPHSKVSFHVSEVPAWYLALHLYLKLLLGQAPNQFAAHYFLSAPSGIISPQIHPSDSGADSHCILHAPEQPKLRLPNRATRSKPLFTGVNSGGGYIVVPAMYAHKGGFLLA